MFDPSCVFNFLTIMFFGVIILEGFYTGGVQDPQMWRTVIHICGEL